MKPEFTPKVAQNQRKYRKRNGSGPARGSMVGGSVLTENMVREMRAMRQGLGMGSTLIQREFAKQGKILKVGTIENVLSFKTWGWLR